MSRRWGDLHSKFVPPGPALLCANPAVTQVGERMKVVKCLTLGWSVGTICIADDPLPRTATVFPDKSVPGFQAALCIRSPLKECSPGIVGHFQLLPQLSAQVLDFMSSTYFRKPDALMKKWHQSSTSSPVCKSFIRMIHTLSSSFQIAEVICCWKFMYFLRLYSSATSWKYFRISVPGE